jgi:hypothetical protein
MEAASTSETSVNFYQTTRRYNPEDSHLHTRRRENLESYESLVEELLNAMGCKKSLAKNSFLGLVYQLFPKNLGAVSDEHGIHFHRETSTTEKRYQGECRPSMVVDHCWKLVRDASETNPPPVALQSLKDLGRLTYRRFLELFRHMVELLGRVISSSQGLCLHRTTQHRKTRTNIHALSGIRTKDSRNQTAKTASDSTATVTGRDEIQA